MRLNVPWGEWSPRSITQRTSCDLFFALQSEDIAGYLVPFNPEPGTAMQDVPRAPIHRLRRVQLAKHLIERESLPRTAFTFDHEGNLTNLEAPAGLVKTATDSGVPFMTDGCPDRAGEVACNRPYGSYRPGEAFRDYPFQPQDEDVATIRDELQLQEVWQGGRAD